MHRRERSAKVYHGHGKHWQCLTHYEFLGSGSFWRDRLGLPQTLVYRTWPVSDGSAAKGKKNADIAISVKLNALHLKCWPLF